MRIPLAQFLSEIQALGIRLATTSDGDLKINAPKGVLTLDLQRLLKEHKADILYLLSLPEPTAPGEETEQNRRKIGEMVRAQSDRIEVQA